MIGEIFHRSFFIPFCHKAIDLSFIQFKMLMNVSRYDIIAVFVIYKNAGIKFNILIIIESIQDITVNTMTHEYYVSIILDEKMRYLSEQSFGVSF